MMDTKVALEKLTTNVIATLDKHSDPKLLDSLDRTPERTTTGALTFNMTKDLGRMIGGKMTNHQRIVYKVTIEASFQDDDADDDT